MVAHAFHPLGKLGHEHCREFWDSLHYMSDILPLLSPPPPPGEKGRERELEGEGKEKVVHCIKCVKI